MVVEGSSTVKKTFPEDSFAGVFWENQEQALSRQNGPQMRWDLVLCLYSVSDFVSNPIPGPSFYGKINTIDIDSTL